MKNKMVNFETYAKHIIPLITRDFGRIYIQPLFIFTEDFEPR